MYSLLFNSYDTFFLFIARFGYCEWTIRITVVCPHPVLLQLVNPAHYYRMKKLKPMLITAIISIELYFS